MLVLWRPLRAISLVVKSCGVKGCGRRQRLEAQLHLIAFVVRNGMFAVVIISIAMLGPEFALLGVQVVGQGATKLVTIVRPHTATARYQNALDVGRQYLVTVAQISVRLGPTTC
jgi:hypothetical protein